MSTAALTCLKSLLCSAHCLALDWQDSGVTQAQDLWKQYTTSIEMKWNKSHCPCFCRFDAERHPGHPDPPLHTAKAKVCPTRSEEEKVRGRVVVQCGLRGCWIAACRHRLVALFRSASAHVLETLTCFQPPARCCTCTWKLLLYIYHATDIQWASAVPFIVVCLWRLWPRHVMRPWSRLERQCALEGVWTQSNGYLLNLLYMLHWMNQLACQSNS